MYNYYQMSDQIKQLIFKPINYYVCGILVFAGVYVYLVVGDAFTLPDGLTWLLGTLSLLLVWQCGVRFPYLGMISMERLVQFHLLLTLPISETIMISTVASLIMPFINSSYRMGSYHIAALRAANNLAMNTIMLLTASLLLNHWLVLPLDVLNLASIQVIAGTAVAMQVINIGMIFIYFSLDKKKISQLFTAAYLLADFVFVPVGVLSALLFLGPDTTLFYLFAFFMVVLLFGFYSFNNTNTSNESAFLNKGTDYHTSYLDLNRATGAISSRCDQLFNCQALYLRAADAAPNDFLIANNQTGFKDLSDFVNQQLTTEDQETMGVELWHSVPLNYMTASFLDHNGVFAQLMVIRDNQVEFLYADLNLLILFVQRYRPGLSYALTYERLTEYKNTLEHKVAERTQQLELANQEKSVLVKKLKKISSIDALTGLYNRRYFDGLLKHLINTPPKEMSLAIVDLDHFKLINDQFGHDTGDQVLKSVALLMKSWAGDQTTLVRYGGEEFVLMFREVAYSEVKSSLIQLQKDLADQDWNALGLKNALTISIGLAHYPEEAISQLFESADKALYHAKANGRNQIVVFESGLKDILKG